MTTYIAMNPTKRKKLTAAGWKVGSAADFLELTPEESVKCPKCNETVSHNLNKNNYLQTLNLPRGCHVTPSPATLYSGVIIRH